MPNPRALLPGICYFFLCGSLYGTPEVPAHTSNAGHTRAYGSSQRLLRARTGTVSVGLFSLPGHLDPIYLTQYAEFMLLHGVFRTLITVQPNGKIVSNLAQSWDFSGNGKIFSFHLDPNAVFQDGTPITAQDVAWSISRHFWPESHSPIKSLLRHTLVGADTVASGHMVSGIVSVNGHTVRLHLSQRFPFLLALLSEPILGILPQHAPHRPLRPVGSGAVHAEFIASEHRWILRRKADAHCTQTLRVGAVSSLDDAYRGLEKGTWDAIIGLPPHSADAPPPSAPWQLSSTTDRLNVYAFVNMQHPQFSDLRFRKDTRQLWQYAVQAYAKAHPSLRPLRQYAPKHMLSAEYDNRLTGPLLTPQQFQAKWKTRSEPTNASWRVLLQAGHLPPGLLQSCQQSFEQAGIRLVFSVLKPEAFAQQATQRKYHFVIGGYHHSAVNPAVLFLPLLPEHRPQYHTGNSEALLEALFASGSIPEYQTRTQALAQALARFEQQASVVPLFELPLSLLHHHMLQVRDPTPGLQRFSPWSLAWQNGNFGP